MSERSVGWVQVERPAGLSAGAAGELEEEVRRRGGARRLEARRVTFPIGSKTIKIETDATPEEVLAAAEAVAGRAAARAAEHAAARAFVAAEVNALRAKPGKRSAEDERWLALAVLVLDGAGGAP